MTELPPDTSLDSLREVLQSARTADGKELARRVRRCRWLAEGTNEQIGAALELIEELGPWTTPGEVALVEGCGTFLQQRSREGGGYEAEWSKPVAAIYQGLPAAASPPHAWLAWLAEASEFPAARRLLVELLKERPPMDDAGVVAVFSPFFQRRQAAAVKLFPQLLELLQHASLAGAVMDLSNYLRRDGWVEIHPAATRQDELIRLLGHLTTALERILEGKIGDASPAQVSQTVSQSVSLVVALCDALALIGSPAAIPNLKRAMELPHRRICAEAAAALARLGDEEGRQRLPQLAEEPVARLRVLEYCRELGLLDQVEPPFLTPVAQAESSLCVWLAEPTQFGVPPAEMELFDRRKMYWPSFAQEVECFLFRFTYKFPVENGQGSYSNIGIAGPLAFALSANVADLPPDDIYAAFAGYQAEHEEIREVEVDRLSQSEKLEAERLKRRLHDAGYENIKPFFIGYFFGEKALAATCTREGVSGAAVADFHDILFFPSVLSQRSLGPLDVYYIHIGRKMLKSFNR